MYEIIVLDDDDALLELIAASLEKAGYRVRKFSEPGTAVESYMKNPCDLIVTDIMFFNGRRVLPSGGMTAIWRLKQLAQNENRYLPIIAISGATQHPGMETLPKTTQQIGADTFLSKPFRPQELIDTIEDLMSVSPGGPET